MKALITSASLSVGVQTCAQRSSTERGVPPQAAVRVSCVVVPICPDGSAGGDFEGAVCLRALPSVGRSGERLAADFSWALCPSARFPRSRPLRGCPLPRRKLISIPEPKHVGMSYAEKPDEISKDEWLEKLNNLHVQRADMNRLIMNYLVTEGFKEAAEKFRMESGIEPSVDLETLDERIKIREMILKGQIQAAIALINSLHPELLDTNRYLYFHLQQQHLIELIRQRETEAALEFAQTQLAEQGEESRECLTEMERTLALLAFDNPEESPFGDLLHMMQRQKVWSEVNQAVLDYENRESTPKLAKLLKLLLWAQNELDQKKVKYPKMTDLSKGVIEEPK
ncbi:glucose-induced degradation protein 8 homolog isoform X3 [Meles meles]|uniref:glucose-induced degradation protein 8 homolog isoform X3 n=1 Tax=Meles meles TaxID=9662 RepID=UPI001E69D9DE|nr:glucose-induced degradation protein 8 homolog isoform X3 [Meles meles]